MLQFIILFITLPFNIVKHEYSDTELLYFAETTFYKQDSYAKWQKPIQVELSGIYSLEDALTVQEIIKDIKPYLNVNISLVKNQGNLKIHFDADTTSYHNRFETLKQNCPLGYMKPTISKKQIFNAAIYLHPALIYPKKHEVLRHELLHALGLLGHSNISFKQENMLANIIFKSLQHQQEVRSNKAIPLLDKLALYRLYHSKKSVLKRKNYQYLYAKVI
ncbi:hypothetical protein [Pedobacter puniceum]|uniref:Matrixin family metalloprotease n=1 Tax=Pedobacter puniceum TaxID=2666136 RepID=A0A7K0FKI1_9SPHI|nr:hypothetical protein [Pedobacter puniceum]MRX45780.1 hypothetical protein [Pedobacter puniceum]